MIINSHVHLDSFMNLEENKLTIDKEYFKIEPKMANAIDIKDLSLSILIQTNIYLKILV